jgi:hypothetical protein
MFTPYYFLAVGFGAFAVIVSLLGMKRPDDFPGKFMGLVILGGVVLGLATFVFVWRGGEKEVDHRKAEEAAQAHETSSNTTLPAGVKPAS